MEVIVGYNYYYNNLSVTNNFIPDVLIELENILGQIEITPIIYIYILRIINETISNTYIFKRGVFIKNISLELSKCVNLIQVISDKNLYNKVKKLFSIKKRIYYNIIIFCVKKRKYYILLFIQKLKFTIRLNHFKKQNITIIEV